MSRISDMEEQISNMYEQINNMYEQIKLKENALIKTKLQEGVKALKEKGELSEEESYNYRFSGENDETILLRILEEQGIGENGYCWISTDRHTHEVGYYILKIDGDYISISPEGWLCMHSIESIKELLDEISEYNWNLGRGVSEYINTITNLTDIDLEHLKPKIQEKMPDEPEVTFEEADYDYEDGYDYEYDDEHDELDDIGYDVRFYDDGTIEVGYYDNEGNVVWAECDLEDYAVIRFILRNGIPYNYDAPEEQTAIILNLISTEELKKYFELYPEDIELFEQMRIKYPNIQSLAERGSEEHSGGDKFVASIVDYATKKVEVRDQNAQAAQLAQDYEQQLPANEQSLDDE